MLVHGAWDGGWIWRPLRSRLVAAGFDVFAPSLTGSADREHLVSPQVGLDTYAADIVNLIRFEQLEQAILVGYSFGGMATTVAASQVREHLRQLVYLDAFVPRDGQSFADLVPDETIRRFRADAEAAGKGWLIPPPQSDDERARALPMKTVTDRVTVEETRMPPRSYIRCVSGEPGGAFDDAGNRAKEERWGYYELRSGHNPMMDCPDELAAILIRIARGQA